MLQISMRPTGETPKETIRLLKPSKLNATIIFYRQIGSGRISGVVDDCIPYASVREIRQSGTPYPKDHICGGYREQHP